MLILSFRFVFLVTFGRFWIGFLMSKDVLCFSCPLTRCLLCSAVSHLPSCVHFPITLCINSPAIPLFVHGSFMCVGGSVFPVFSDLVSIMHQKTKRLCVSLGLISNKYFFHLPREYLLVVSVLFTQLIVTGVADYIGYYHKILPN